jgi:HEPN domain-containing protein
VPQDRSIPGSPQEWLARARGDLALARAPLPPGGFYEYLCFHAQQAAEKALKAVYLHYGWIFRYVHDPEELITGLQQNGLRVPEAVEDAVVLTSYAFEAQYPGLAEPVSEEEYRQAIELAQMVVRWAEEMIERGQA